MWYLHDTTGQAVCCLAHGELAWLVHEPHTGLDDCQSYCHALEKGCLIGEFLVGPDYPAAITAEIRLRIRLIGFGSGGQVELGKATRYLRRHCNFLPSISRHK